MADEKQVESPKSSGGTFKIVLIVVILLLLGGVGTAIFILLPEKVPVIETYIWPESGEPALDVATTLSDASAHVTAVVRIRTVACDLTTLKSKMKNELEQKRSIVMSVLTEVANNLDATSAYRTQDFRRRAVKQLNEELQETEIEDLLVENWLVTPTR